MGNNKSKHKLGRFGQVRNNDDNVYGSVRPDNLYEDIDQYADYSSRRSDEYGRLDAYFPDRSDIYGYIGNRRRELFDDRQWCWTWLDECGTFKVYGASGTNNNAPAITSQEIEKSYQKNRKGSFKFSIGSHQYMIDFSKFVQKNLKSGKERKVCRHLYTDSHRWRWTWRDECGNYKEYGAYGTNNSASTITSQKIERYYQRNQMGVFTFKVGPSHYLIDFARFVQRNLNTGVERKVYREYCTVPQALLSATSHNDRYHIIQIANYGSTFYEYQDIESLFHETCPRSKYRVTKITCINNRGLWEHYLQRRRSMERELPFGMPLDERLLFHGTVKSADESICEQGFDWRLAGKRKKTGTLYGKGSYFAAAAQYSLGFTDNNMLFVAQVLVGHYTQGTPDMVKPPSINPRNPLGSTYDSCVDNVERPNIFVIFAQDQAYPAYQIMFQEIS